MLIWNVCSFFQSSPRPYRTMLEVAVCALQETASATPKQRSTSLSLRETSALCSKLSLGEPASEISDSSPTLSTESGRRESSPTPGTDSSRGGFSESVNIRDGKPITSKLDNKSTSGDGTSPVFASDMNRNRGTEEDGEKVEDDGVVFKSTARKNRYEK